MSQLRITEVEVIPVEVPRVGRLKLQRGDAPQVSPFTLIRISTNDGIVGWGEGNSTVRGLHHIASANLVEILHGRDPLDLGPIHAAMDELEMMRVERLGHWNVLRAAIDMALWDIRGRFLGMPIHELLGGRRRDVIASVRNISVGSVVDATREAEDLVEAGYTHLKVRVGKEPALDVQRVTAIRRTLDENIAIRVDANQAWTVPIAVSTINRMCDVSIECVEQPCAYWDLDGAAEVARRVPVPLMADEGFWTLPEARLVLEKRAATILHVYLGKCGGITPVWRMAALAEAHEAEVSLGERVPLGISLAAHLQVAAALPRLTYACALAYELNAHDLLTEPIPLTGGCFRVPDRPGLGIDVDEEKVRFYALR
jgi:L-alanine-DL-glutamate epimerase-like enolase superfamily enzyme